MRVIAGVHRGRRLMGPKGQAIRPTSDRVKEALFSILGERTIGARVLDLYAGTGSVGIEALSRGAAHVTFVEAGREALRLVQSNLRACGYEPYARICSCEVGYFFRHETDPFLPYNIVFCDPPYESVGDVVSLMNEWDSRWLTADAVVILEHGRKTYVPPVMGFLAQVKRYGYGDTTLTRFERTSKDAHR